MTLHNHIRLHTGFHLPIRTKTRTTPDTPATASTTATTTHATAAARSLAVLRIATGFIFLWAFLDKLFGWHYATATGKGWTDGGSPTKGFLSNVSAGPLQSFFHTIAGQTWTDWTFMLALLGLGIALTTGIALRITAIGGTILMAMMWAAEWPLAQHLSNGDPSGSSNPLVDYHFLYALAMIAFALTAAGTTWGLARTWARLPLIRTTPWLQ
ncbi:hypothetical protein OG552_27710 [Streptomyces sp. NBC_01476]|uniref:hypothetical protein n=1 Tax=Streptomyces sp. NBC_01476 TaxID=2903881 RepID=UPI002E33A355|nr:hypothetical protein [Streptomyces sp. NBC_01476]